MTDIERDICETQQMIYEHMCNQGYDMKSFSDAYLRSDFCRRAMDTLYSRFQLEFPTECEDFFWPEIKDQVEKMEDGLQFDVDVACWIGYTYRQLYFETQIPSRELVELIPFEVMCQYYPGMHTIDEEEAAELMIKNMKRNWHCDM